MEHILWNTFFFFLQVITFIKLDTMNLDPLVTSLRRDQTTLKLLKTDLLKRFAHELPSSLNLAFAPKTI